MSRIWRTWASTVFALTKICCAIAWFERPSVERADVLVELAFTFRADARRRLGPGAPRTMIELLDEALVEAGADDARAARTLAARTGGQGWRADRRSALADGREGLRRAERVGDPVLLAITIARCGLAESYTVEITPSLLERGAEIEERLGLVLEYYKSPRRELNRLLMQLGEVERHRAILEALAESAAARGDEGTRLMVLWRLGLLEWLAGRWSQALDTRLAILR